MRDIGRASGKAWALRVSIGPDSQAGDSNGGIFHIGLPNVEEERKRRLVAALGPDLSLGDNGPLLQ